MYIDTVSYTKLELDVSSGFNLVVTTHYTELTATVSYPDLYIADVVFLELASGPPG